MCFLFNVYNCELFLIVPLGLICNEYSFYFFKRVKKKDKEKLFSVSQI